MFAIGRFPEAVGVLDSCDARGVPLRTLFVFVTLLGFTVSVPVFFLHVGGFLHRCFSLA